MASSTDMTYIPLQESESVSENMEIDESREVAPTYPLFFIDKSRSPVPVCPEAADLAPKNPKQPANQPSPVSRHYDPKIHIITNYFGSNSSLSEIYHYDVEIKIDPINRRGLIQSEYEDHVRIAESSSVSAEKCKQVFAELLRENNCKNFKYIYDGKRNLLTSEDLRISGKTAIEFSMPADSNYVITIQPIIKYNSTKVFSDQLRSNMTTDRIDADPNDLLDLMKDIARRNNYSGIHFDRYFTFSHESIWNIGNGLEIWHCYVTLAKGRPAVISKVDFHEPGPVINYVNKLLGSDITNKNKTLESNEIEEIKGALNRLQIRTTNFERVGKHHIEDICNMPASNTFVRVEDEEISIPEYFQMKNMPVIYPHLPCVRLKRNKIIYVPFEYCEIIEGQPKLESYNTDTLNRLEFGEPSLLINISPKVLQGDVSSPPELKYKEASQIYPDTKRWQTQRESSNILKNYSWIVLSFVDKGKLSENKIQKFLCQLNEADSSMGVLKSGQCLGIRIFEAQNSVHEVREKVQREVRNATLAIILLEGKKEIYDEIKFTVTHSLERISQCVTYETIYKLNSKMARNLCSNISAKLGNLTYKFTKAMKLFSLPIIIFGNAFSNVKKIGRIASIVGSLDAYPFRYQVSCRIQGTQNEFIEHLEDMVKTILNSFYHSTRGLYPEKIIFFRKNIGDFKSLIYREVRPIQNACEDTIGRIVPITFIQVAKKSNTKFKEANSKYATGIKNIPLETTNITECTEYDIYFHYYDATTSFTVIHDDNKFNKDELKELTGHMCNAFVGNKCLTVPAPMRYAKNAADHSAEYANYLFGKCEEKTVVDAIHKMERNKNHMFFL